MPNFEQILENTGNDKDQNNKRKTILGRIRDNSKYINKGLQGLALTSIGVTSV
jgi:hypothetical protein